MLVGIDEEDVNYLISFYAINLIIDCISKHNHKLDKLDKILDGKLSIHELERLLDHNLFHYYKHSAITLFDKLNTDDVNSILSFNYFKYSIIVIKTFDACVQLKAQNNNYTLELHQQIFNVLFHDGTQGNKRDKKWQPKVSINTLSTLMDLLQSNDYKPFFPDTPDQLAESNHHASVNNWLSSLQGPLEQALANIMLISNSFEKIRVEILGKNGLLTFATRALAGLPPDDRKVIGSFFNNLKRLLQHIISLAQERYQNIQLQKKLISEKIDITLPIYNINNGGIHPLSHTLEEIISIFSKLGFKIAEGPEIENDWYNFSALNFHDYHPAKNSHDTFYFQPHATNQRLLRTHTSTVQIRVMQNTSPPIQIIAPGRVYRSDDDATHTPMFHQLEGLYINKDVSVADLKGLLIEFCEIFFNIKNVPLRFRPSYFPFTSPSLEIDIGCQITKAGVNIGKGNDWLEILGCGMVHPKVLMNCNIDPQEYQGFAFGIGIERMAMLKYGFPDLRDFFYNNYLWLKSYKFNVMNNLYNRLQTL